MFVGDQPSCEPPEPEPGPGPGFSVDAAERRVAELSGIINVATAELVDTLALIEASGDWGVGYRSFQHWVQVHTGASPSRAKDLVAVARRVVELPETMAKFRDGALAEGQVVPIARHVPTTAEASVAELATHATASQMNRVCRSYRFPEPVDPTDPNGDLKDAEDDEARDTREATEARESQSTSFGWDDEGFWRMAASLVREDGALAQKALEAARDELFAERNAAKDDTTEDIRVTWADAFVRMSEHALAHMSDGKDSGTRDRNQIIIHRRLPDTNNTTGNDPAAWLHRGPAISPQIADYLSCDADSVEWFERDGRPVKLGRKTRTVPNWLRRLIEDRDKGCRVPGCDGLRWLHSHHIIHWAKGGKTDPCNLCALCQHHHRALHRGELTIEGNAEDPNGLTFRDKHGRIIPNGPQPIHPDKTKPPKPGNWQHPTGAPLNPRWIHFNQNLPPPDG